MRLSINRPTISRQDVVITTNINDLTFDIKAPNSFIQAIEQSEWYEDLREWFGDGMTVKVQHESMVIEAQMIPFDYVVSEVRSMGEGVGLAVTVIEV